MSPDSISDASLKTDLSRDNSSYNSSNLGVTKLPKSTKAFFDMTILDFANFSLLKQIF